MVCYEAHTPTHILGTSAVDFILTTTHKNGFQDVFSAHFLSFIKVFSTLLFLLKNN